MAGKKLFKNFKGESIEILLEMAVVVVRKTIEIKQNTQNVSVGH